MAVYNALSTFAIPILNRYRYRHTTFVMCNNQVYDNNDAVSLHTEQRARASLISPRRGTAPWHEEERMELGPMAVGAMDAGHGLSQE